MASSFTLLFWLTQVVNVSAFGILCVYVVYYDGGLAWSPDYSHQFNWHIILLPLALVHITALEVMLFRCVRFLNRVQVKQVHAVLGAVALVITVVGFWSVMQPYFAFKSTQFSSLHGWLGLITAVFYLLQVVIGVATYLWPGLPINFRSPYTPLHVFFGLAIFVFGTLTSLLGLFEHIKKIKAWSGLGVTMNICAMLMVVLTTLVVYVQTRPEYTREALVKSKRSKNPA